MGKTVGIKELLLLFCILLFCLLLAVFYAENFPSAKNDISSSLNNTSSVDYDYYHNYEKKMEEAAKKYIKDTNYNVHDAFVSIELETLINTSLIDSLYDKKTDNKCTGYVIVSSDTDYKGYLQCNEYKTVG